MSVSVVHSTSMNWILLFPFTVQRALLGSMKERTITQNTLVGYSKGFIFVVERRHNSLKQKNMFSPCSKISKQKRRQLVFFVASFYAAALLTAVGAAIL